MICVLRHQCIMLGVVTVLASLMLFMQSTALAFSLPANNPSGEEKESDPRLQEMHSNHRYNEEYLPKGQFKSICNICGKGFRLQHYFEQHTKVHFNEFRIEEGTYEGKNDERGAEGADEGGAADESRVCPICHKIFATAYNRNRHTLTHGQPSIPCKTCGKKFRRADTYRRHVTTMHYMKGVPVNTSGRPFICTTCGRGFNAREGLARHKKLHSADQPTFKCTHCSVHFRRRDNMMAHVRQIHSSDNPRCALCSRVFRNDRELSRHLEQHYNVSVSI